MLVENSGAQTSWLPDSARVLAEADCALIEQHLCQHCSPPDTAHAPTAHITVHYDAMLLQTHSKGSQLGHHLQQKHMGSVKGPAKPWQGCTYKPGHICKGHSRHD